MFDADAWVAEQAAKSFVSFRLGGEVFHVRAPLPAWPGMRLAREQVSTIESWARFLRDVVMPVEADRVDGAIERSGISADGLLEVCKHIVEDSVARPTTPRSGTSGTRQPRGQSSKSAGRNRGSTSRPSLSVAS